MVAEAVKAGYRVRATDVSSRFYGAMFEALDVEFMPSDLTKREGLDRLLSGVDKIIHVAGIHDYSTPDNIIFSVNAHAVENLCGAAIKANINQFLHFSSVGVYGYSSNPGKPVKEDDPKVTPPLNNYNVSKWEGEKIIHKYIREHGLRATIFRPGAIYGSRSVYRLYLVFKMAFDERNKKKKIILGKGDKIEAFLHVQDMCRAVIYACDREEMMEKPIMSPMTPILPCRNFMISSTRSFWVKKTIFPYPFFGCKAGGSNNRFFVENFQVQTCY